MSGKKPFLETLDRYAEIWLGPFPDRENHYGRLRTFVEKEKECFSRGLLKGHVTGSALIVNPDETKVLLTHHRKLNKWLQLGGHLDPGEAVHEGALREAKEESGLKVVDFLPYQTRFVPWPSPIPFDVDIHPIPQRGNEPDHFHYDVAFLFKTSSEEIVMSDESHALKWFSWEEAHGVTEELSMRRQFEKFAWLRELV